MTRSGARSDSETTLRAVLFDRDDTLIADPGDHLDGADVVILPGAVEAVQLANRLGLATAVVTNQGRIARGIVSRDSVDRFNERVGDQFASRGARLGPFYVCPHHPAALRPSDRVCTCRKPLPGNLLLAARDAGVEPHACLLVGNSDDDRRAAANAGMRFGMVDARTGPLVVLRTALRDHSSAI